jgi:hypothetical protein
MANDEDPRTNDRVVPHADDGYSDGTLGMPISGYHGLGLSAKQLPHKAEPIHRERLWTGIPWKMILLACAGVIAALLVFGVLFTLLVHL